MREFVGAEGLSLVPTNIGGGQKFVREFAQGWPAQMASKEENMDASAAAGGGGGEGGGGGGGGGGVPSLASSPSLQPDLYPPHASPGYSHSSDAPKLLTAALLRHLPPCCSQLRSSGTWHHARPSAPPTLATMCAIMRGTCVCTHTHTHTHTHRRLLTGESGNTKEGEGRMGGGGEVGDRRSIDDLRVIREGSVLSDSPLTFLVQILVNFSTTSHLARVILRLLRYREYGYKAYRAY